MTIIKINMLTNVTFLNFLSNLRTSHEPSGGHDPPVGKHSSTHKELLHMQNTSSLTVKFQLQQCDTHHQHTWECVTMHTHTHTRLCTCAHVHTQPAQHKRNIMYLYFKNTTQLCGCWSLRKSDAPLGTPSAIPVVVGLELMIFNTGHYSAYTLITLPKYTAYTILVVAHHVSCQLWFNGWTPLFYCCIRCPWLATTRWES
jgi:hypothetical protein